MNTTQVLRILSFKDTKNLLLEEEELNGYAEVLEPLWDHVVESHYSGFNTTMESYLGVVESMKEARKTMVKMKPDLDDIKSLMSNRSRDMQAMWMELTQAAEAAKAWLNTSLNTCLHTCLF